MGRYSLLRGALLLTEYLGRFDLKGVQWEWVPRSDDSDDPSSTVAMLREGSVRLIQ